MLNRTLARVTVWLGLPAAGGMLLAVNHTAPVDGTMLYGLLPRPVLFLLKAEVLRPPPGALLLRHTQRIPVNRGVAERPADGSAGDAAGRREMQLPAGPAARRTVAAAAAEIHRTLAAHVAATRPDPTRAPEDRQP